MNGVISYQQAKNYTNQKASSSINYTNQSLVKYTSIGLVQDGTAVGVGITRLLPSPMPKTGVLTKISVFAKTTGTLKIKRFTRTGTDTFHFVEEISVSVSQLGLNEITIQLTVNKDDYIGLYSADAQFTYVVSATINYYKLSGDIITDSTLELAIGTTRLCVLFVLQTQGTVTSTLLKSNFTGTLLPDNNFINNGFTLNNGLQSPSVGGTGVTAYWEIYSTLDKHKLRSLVKINDIASIFSLIKKYTTHGAVGTVDCENMKLRLYKAWSGGELPVEVINTDITLDIVAGRSYLVVLEKNGSVHTLSITDTTTLQTNLLTYDNSKVAYSMYAGKQWGSPGVMFLKGGILVKKLEFVTSDASPFCVIIGDSITEGFGLDNNIANYEDRWCAKLRAVMNGNCVISGRGSANSADLITRMAWDVNQYAPRYVIVLIGANDSDLTTWQNNINKIASNILSIGAEPIFCVPPSGDLRVEMGTYLRTLNYTVMGFDYATTVNNDGVTLDATLFSDGIHLNKIGHLKMFNQVKIDAPFLFD